MSGNPVIRFTKATACGNDFLIASAAEAGPDLAAITRRMCNRHNGVGADGVEWLFPDREADTAARLFNADGSEAEISGNGTRCVAAQLCSQSGKSEVVIRTGAGLKTCRLTRRDASTFEFETGMGDPVVGEELVIETTLGSVGGMKVSMGNPHFVIFAENFPEGWQRQAAQIGVQPQFPQGANVEYVVVRSAHEIEIRLFERGVGETKSSGTGSCAAAVAAVASRRVSSPVMVTAPGGTQQVRWDEQVYLAGSATLICRGEYLV